MKYIKTIILAVCVFFMGACSTVQDIIYNEPIVAKSAIQYGTLKYIDGDDQKDDQVIEYATDLKEQIETDEYETLDIVISKIKQDIAQSDSIEAPEKLIALNIVDAVKEYAVKKLNEQDLSLDEYKATATVVIDWIIEAAELSQIGVTSDQIG